MCWPLQEASQTNLDEVAQRAAVSTPTVLHVLSHAGVVRNATRLRVMRTISQLLPQPARAKEPYRSRSSAHLAPLPTSQTRQPVSNNALPRSSRCCGP